MKETLANLQRLFPATLTGIILGVHNAGGNYFPTSSASLHEKPDVALPAFLSNLSAILLFS